MPGGAEGQIGWASEATPGTGVTVDTFQPFRSESIKQNIEYVDTQTVSSRLTTRLTKQGSKIVEGSVTTELANTDLAELMAHMFGGVSFLTDTHTFTPVDSTGEALTIQVGRPSSSGTVHAFTYAGCKIASWSIAASVGEIATLEFSVIGMTETTATALATASYDATWEPYIFTEAAITIAGSPVATVKEFSLDADNAIESRVRVGAQTSVEPVPIGLRTYEGTVVTDFDDLTHYNLYVDGTETAIVATFTNSSGDVLTITMNVQFTGETPEVGGFDLLEQSLPYRVLSSTSDADGITATLTNSESEFTFPA